LKSVFIIAIVAVAMIGVMVPSADAANLVTNDYFLEVAEEPERYTDSNVKLSGQIEVKQIFENSILYIFQVGGIDNSNRDQISVYTDKNHKSFFEDDCLIIEGTISGVTELTNKMYSDPWDVPYMWLDDYTKIDCLEALYPTIAESTISQTQHMGGAKVTIEKVQWSDDHTRILLTVDNTSANNEITIYQHTSVLIQDRTQFESKGVCCSVDYLDGSIPYGSASKGWWVFEPTDPESFEIRVAVYETAENWRENEDYDMIFNINSIHDLSFSSSSPVPNPIPKPILESIPLGIASFVDQTKDPQHYIDRYNNEPTYKEWFDENYSQYDSIEQAVGYDEWSSGSFSIDKQEYHLGEKIFITANLLPEDNGTVQFLRPISDTRHEVYIQIPFDGMAKSQFNYYFEPKYDESKGICSIDDIAGNWIVRFSGTQYEDINFKILDQTASWDDRSFEPLEKNGQCAVDTHIPTEMKCGSGTEDVNGICQVIQTEEKSKGGGCLIATATYGSELAPQVQQLRELRDNQLLQTESGKQFMGTFNDIYYSFSPTIADMEREHPMFKEAVKLAITPMISSLSLMENAESESEVLSIGLSVIMLNLGMYLGVPAIVIVGIRRKF